jgi:hypothetical protein
VSELSKAESWADHVPRATVHTPLGEQRLASWHRVLELGARCGLSLRLLCRWSLPRACACSTFCSKGSVRWTPGVPCASVPLPPPVNMFVRVLMCCSTIALSRCRQAQHTLMHTTPVAWRPASPSLRRNREAISNPQDLTRLVHNGLSPLEGRLHLVLVISRDGFTPHAGMR